MKVVRLPAAPREIPIGQDRERASPRCFFTRGTHQAQGIETKGLYRLPNDARRAPQEAAAATRALSTRGRQGAQDRSLHLHKLGARTNPTIRALVPGDHRVPGIRSDTRTDIRAGMDHIPAPQGWRGPQDPGSASRLGRGHAVPV